jgi:predicted  nucleic acid-binding Zn-ribbon protein
MKNRLITLLTLALLAIAAQSLIAAAPGEHHHSQQKPIVDWKSYPADIQALKVELDKIRAEQKGIFETIKSQREQIRSARKELTSDLRKELKKPAEQNIEQMRATRDDIHTLRNQKHDAWDSFQEHADKKEWSSAKNDMQTIIKQKKQIVEKQQGIVKLQKQLIGLINPTNESHIHSEG